MAAYLWLGPIILLGGCAMIVFQCVALVYISRGDTERSRGDDA